MRRRAAACGAVVLFVAGAVVHRAGAANGHAPLIRTQDLRAWLTYIASDQLQGRALYSTGLGLAAAFIEDHLRGWMVTPGGDPGSYLQTVRVIGVKATSHSTVTVEVGGQRRTFADGEGIVFPRNVGGKRQLSIDRVEFAGYGFDAPDVTHRDFAGKNVKGAAIVWLGRAGPRSTEADIYRRALAGRTRYATDVLGAAAGIGPPPDEAEANAASASNGGAGGRRGQPTPDFTTTERLDKPVAPNVAAADSFMDFLFSRAPVSYQELKRKADAQEDLPTFRLDGVRLVFDIDASYEIVRTRFAQNVVGVIEGTDPQLKHTYVAFSAHYDHVGYADGEVVNGRRMGAPGHVTESAVEDRIWNGADDDGSGTVTVMAIAHAFAQGPRPKRSILLIWHTGEESGLLGSKYFADYPTVPLDRIVAELNIDMIGRNRDDRPSESNTVYLVGSDRISSELHAISRAANAAQAKPLSLDYTFNDPTEVEHLYFRSDHYSYAAKGIPVIFFFTGLHPDYHANTDEVSKIQFDKMTRIAQMIYETGLRVANLDHAPLRDNLGARTGHDTK